MSEPTLEQVALYGHHYCPAVSHYGAPDSYRGEVRCDSCGRESLHACIGCAQKDLCLPCADRIQSQSAVLQRREQQRRSATSVPRPPPPPTPFAAPQPPTPLVPQPPSHPIYTPPSSLYTAKSLGAPIEHEHWSVANNKRCDNMSCNYCHCLESQ